LEKAKGEREMKINVNVEVPDEEYCDRCDYLLNFTDIDELQKLANAIIIQAAKDYRTALRKLRRNPRNHLAQAEAESIEQFFRSDWYKCLTDVDGEMVIRKLREED
jgi:hypothetical protein